MPPKPVKGKDGEKPGQSTPQTPGGLVPAKPVAQRAGQAPTASGVQQTTTAGKLTSGPPPKGLVAARQGQERTGQAPVGAAVASQAPTAAKAPAQAPTAARAGKAPKAVAAQAPTAAQAAQAPTAARAGQASKATAGQAPTAAKAGQPPTATAGQAPTAAKKGQATGPPGRGGMAGGRGAGGMDGPQSRGGMVGPPGRGGMAGGPVAGGMAGPLRKDGLPGGPGAGGMDGPQSRGGMVGLPGRGGGGEGQPPGSDSAMGADPPNYSHARVLHRSNPFIVRAIETVLAVTILAALIIADLPLKKTVWIHFAFSSPLIPIATLFGVAALYHRNPLDSVFTLILLVFCFIMYLFAAIQVVMRWLEIKRNRAQRPPIWITVMQLTFFIVIALLIDIIWYICFLMGCPCFVILSQKFTKNKDGTKEKTKVDKVKKGKTELNKADPSYVSAAEK